MDERRTVKLGETYRSFAEAERRVIPIVSKCLEGMVSAAKAVDERKVSEGRRLRWLPQVILIFRKKFVTQERHDHTVKVNMYDLKRSSLCSKVTTSKLNTKMHCGFFFLMKVSLLSLNQ